MKCPVCHTKTNQAICPNCGFTLKKEEQTIVKETVSQQSIPQEDDFDLDKHFRKHRRIRLIIRGIGGLIALLCMGMGAFNSFYDKTFNNEPYGTYSSLTAKDILGEHKIYDVADKHIHELINIYKDLSIQSEYGSVYNTDYTIYYLKDSTHFEYKLRGYKTQNDKQIEYATTIEGNENSLYSVTLYIKGQYNDGYNKSYQNLNKSDLDVLFTHFGLDDVSDALSLASTKLKIRKEAIVETNNVKRVIEKNTYSGNTDGYDISITESYSAFFNITNYEYTIKKVKEGA